MGSKLKPLPSEIQRLRLLFLLRIARRLPCSVIRFRLLRIARPPDTILILPALWDHGRIKPIPPRIHQSHGHPEFMQRHSPKREEPKSTGAHDRRRPPPEHQTRPAKK